MSYFESLHFDYSLLVRIKPGVDRIEAAREDVLVSKGVSVTIRKSRTITRAVEFVSSTTKTFEVEAGLKAAHLEVLKATVKREVQKQTGVRSEESETIEHTVTLPGAKAQKYTLSWTDSYRHGTVQIDTGESKRTYPFSWRESTEFQVVPA